MTRAMYKAIWTAKRPGGWLWRSVKKGVIAEIFGIRVRVNLVARVKGVANGTV